MSKDAGDFIVSLFGEPCQIKTTIGPAFRIGDHPEYPSIWWIFQEYEFETALRLHREYHDFVDNLTLKAVKEHKYPQLELQSLMHKKDLFTKICNTGQSITCKECGRVASFMSSRGDNSYFCSLACYYIQIVKDFDLKSKLNEMNEVDKLLNSFQLL